MPIRRLEDTFTGTSGTIGVDELSSSALDSIRSPIQHVKPHIQPGTLQPAIAGKLLDGTTSHSGAYGTAQTQSGGDGLKYYYTDIKGSKPIKDPRIGAHFGSQRYTCSSLQRLDQETAIHGKNTYSIDGREWMRIQGNIDRPDVASDDTGNYIRCGNAGNARAVELEITGYFNKANISGFTNAYAGRKWESCWVNGTEVTTDTTFVTAQSSPHSKSTYNNSGTLIPIQMGTVTSPQLTTIKLVHDSDGESNFYSIELIAQDDTSVTTKSQIQFPAQTVVSYGKKFSLSASASHYNPFAFKTDGTTAWASGAHNGTAWPVGTGSSANIDTATSLGLSAWISTNYYKPYNGGRVVWWIDSSGTLKCSVNMMPPNARNISSTAAAEKGDDSAGTTSAAVANNTYLPTFTDQAMDHSQAEVARACHWREFGNGSANGGSGSSTWPDASMLNSADAIAYVMDDGLTSLSSPAVQSANPGGNNPIMPNADGNYMYLTFIGTGLSIEGTNNAPGVYNIVQNLPYGTHVIQIYRDADATPDFQIDNVSITDAAINTYGEATEFIFHQPKMPPIPENACILADYMLMADFISVGEGGFHAISKGSRKISLTRDCMFDSSASLPAGAQSTGFSYGMIPCSSGSAETTVKLPAFASEITLNGETGTDSPTSAKNSWGGNAITLTQQSGGSGVQENLTYSSGTKPALGYNIFQHLMMSGGHRTTSFDIATPIHTSFHYQTFETPYLHELVGGDRNMEQTNLVVTADGKTWDEVTRDTSYIGNICCRMSTDTGVVWANFVIFDEWRGTITAGTHNRPVFTKDFAIAYNGLICLKDGEYELYAQTHGSGQHQAWTKNGSYISGYAYSNANAAVANLCYAELSRGDFIQLRGVFGTGDLSYNDAHIKRLK